MIRNEEGLRRTREAIGNLERVLASLERDKDKMHPSWYAVMSEPAIEQLRELRSEINDYLSVVKSASSEIETPVSVSG